jgi:hypothetical protein
MNWRENGSLSGVLGAGGQAVADGKDSRITSPASTIVPLVSNNLERLAVGSRALVVIAAIIALVALGLALVVNDGFTRGVLGGGALLLMLIVTVLIYRVSRATAGEMNARPTRRSERC